VSGNSLAECCGIVELVHHLSMRTDEGQIDLRRLMHAEHSLINSLRLLSRWNTCKWLPTVPAQLALMLRGHCLICSERKQKSCVCQLCTSGVLYSWDLQTRGKLCPSAEHMASLDVPWVGSYFLQEDASDTQFVAVQKDTEEIPWTSAAHFVHLVVERMSTAEAAERLPPIVTGGRLAPRTVRGGIGGRIATGDAHLHFLTVVHPTKRPPVATLEASDILEELSHTQEGRMRIACAARDLLAMQMHNVRREEVWEGIADEDRRQFALGMASYCVGDVCVPIRDSPLLASTLCSNLTHTGADHEPFVDRSWRPHSLQGILRISAAELDALESSGRERRLATRRKSLERWDLRRKRMFARCIVELRRDDVVGVLWRAAPVYGFEDEKPPAGFECCPNALLFTKWEHGAVLFAPVNLQRVRRLRSLYHAFTNDPETLLRPLRIYFRYVHAMLAPLQMPVRKLCDPLTGSSHMFADPRPVSACAPTTTSCIHSVMGIVQSMLAGESTNRHGLVLRPWQGGETGRAAAEPNDPVERKMHIAQRVARAPHTLIGAWLRALCSQDYRFNIDVLHVYERLRGGPSPALNMPHETYGSADSLGATLVFEVRHRDDEGRQLEHRGMRFYFTILLTDLCLAVGEYDHEFISWHHRDPTLPPVPPRTRREWREAARTHLNGTRDRCDAELHPRGHIRSRLGLLNSVLSCAWVKKAFPPTNVGHDFISGSTVGERSLGARVLRARVRARARTSPLLHSFETMDKCHCRYLGFRQECRCTGQCNMGGVRTPGLGRDAAPGAQASIVDYLDSE